MPQPIDQGRIVSQCCQPNISSQLSLLVLGLPAGFLRTESWFPRKDPVSVRSGPQDLPPRRYVYSSTDPQTLLALAHLVTGIMTLEEPPEHLQIVSKF